MTSLPALTWGQIPPPTDDDLFHVFMTACEQTPRWDWEQEALIRIARLLDYNRSALHRFHEMKAVETYVERQPEPLDAERVFPSSTLARADRSLEAFMEGYVPDPKRQPPPPKTYVVTLVEQMEPLATEALEPGAPGLPPGD